MEEITSLFYDNNYKLTLFGKMYLFLFGICLFINLVKLSFIRLFRKGDTYD